MTSPESMVRTRALVIDVAGTAPGPAGPGTGGRCGRGGGRDAEGLVTCRSCPEAEAELGPLDLDMPVAQGGQAVGLWLSLGVLVVADADQRRLQQPDDGRPAPSRGAARAGAGPVATRARMCGRARPKSTMSVELGRRRAPPCQSWVVAVLLAALLVAPGGLDVAVGGAGRSRPPSTPAGSPGNGCGAAPGRRVPRRLPAGGS